jgi:hypothetical protein
VVGHKKQTHDLNVCTACCCGKEAQKLPDQTRDLLRLKHYSLRTECAAINPALTQLFEDVRSRADFKVPRFVEHLRSFRATLVQPNNNIVHRRPVKPLGVRFHLCYCSQKTAELRNLSFKDP